MAKSRSIFLTALLCLGFTAPALAAEEQQGMSGGDAAAESEPRFSDQQLESFVAAALELRAIRQEWGPKIKNAESEEAASAMRSEGVEEMKAAVIDHGLSPDTYNQIGQAVRNDPELQERVTTIAQAMQPGGMQAN